ncbi:MAG TPA: ferrous iron transport protein A [Syntrophomonas sp.]|nr:ferrous iron transport protein A [Syntrophomonas sp.]
MNYTQISLNQLPLGRKANVTMLTSDGATRRRMLDLGIIDGTDIEPLYKSPSGNPVAYLIRGAVIALRSDVSEKIIVSES